MQHILFALLSFVTCLIVAYCMYIAYIELLCFTLRITTPTGAPDNFYTPGIRSIRGYIVFAFSVCLSVNFFLCRSFLRNYLT